MRRGNRSLGVIAVVVGVFAAILLYLSWPAATGKPGGTLIASLAAALLVTAVMLLAASVVERRRTRGPI